MVTIGASFTGILVVYKFARELQNVDLVDYDKDVDMGGTQVENRYPNCACDGNDPNRFTSAL